MKNILDCKNSIKNILKNKIGLIYSDVSGVGKTTYINNLKRPYTKIIHLPLVDHLNKKKLIKQLGKEINIDDNLKNIIHIDLFDSKNK